MSAPTTAAFDALEQIAARVVASPLRADDAADAVLSELHADTGERAAAMLAALARLGAVALLETVRAEVEGRAS